MAEEEVLVSVCDCTGRVAVLESHVLNLYSCESGPFEHVCELRVALPGHAPISSIQFLHPWFACMSDNEVQVSYLDVVKRRPGMPRGPNESGGAAGVATENIANDGSSDDETEEDQQDETTDFVFDAVSGRDLLATSESTPAKLAVHPLESAAFDLNSVSSSSRIDTPNEVFEGPLELVHDCRDTAKAIRFNSACGYRFRPNSGGFRHVLYRRYWRHEQLTILTLVPFAGGVRSQGARSSTRLRPSVNTPDTTDQGTNIARSGTQLLVGSRTRISCYLLQHPDEVAFNAKAVATAPTNRRRVKGRGGRHQHDHRAAAHSSPLASPTSSRGNSSMREAADSISSTISLDNDRASHSLLRGAARRVAELPNPSVPRDCACKSTHEYCFSDDNAILSISTTPNWLFVNTKQGLEVWTYPHWFLPHRNAPRSSTPMHSSYGSIESDSDCSEDSLSACSDDAGSMNEIGSRESQVNVARRQFLQQIHSCSLEDVMFNEWAFELKNTSWQNPSRDRQPTSDTSIVSSPPLLCFSCAVTAFSKTNNLGAASAFAGKQGQAPVGWGSESNQCFSAHSQRGISAGGASSHSGFTVCGSVIVSSSFRFSGTSAANGSDAANGSSTGSSPFWQPDRNNHRELLAGLPPPGCVECRQFCNTNSRREPQAWGQWQSHNPHNTIHVATFASLGFVLAQTIMCNAQPIEEQPKCLSLAAGLWNWNSAGQPRYSTFFLLEAYSILQTSMFELESLGTRDFDGKHFGRSSTVLQLTARRKLQSSVTLLEFLSEAIAVNILESSKVSQSNFSQSSLPGPSGIGHSLSRATLSSLFLINGLSPVSAVLNRLMADGGPQSGLLATYLRLLAQVTSSSPSVLLSGAPPAINRIEQHDSFSGQGGMRGRYADNFGANCDMGLLVAMAQHRRLARMNRAGAAQLSIDTTHLLQPLLEKLDGASVGVVEAIPELVQFPVFTRELQGARALLEAIERMLPAIYANTSSSGEAFRARSSCTRVVLRCFLLVETERNIREDRERDARTESSQNPESEVESQPGTSGNIFGDGLVLALVNEDAPQALIKMLRTVSTDALRNFCVDMLAVLLRMQGVPSAKIRATTANASRHVRPDAGVAQFSLLFWHCVARATPEGAWFVADIFKESLGSLDGICASRIERRQAERSFLRHLGKRQREAGAHGGLIPTALPSMRSGRASNSEVKEGSSNYGDPVGLSMGRLHLASQMLNVFQRLLWIESPAALRRETVRTDQQNAKGENSVSSVLACRIPSTHSSLPGLDIAHAVLETLHWHESSSSDGDSGSSEEAQSFCFESLLRRRALKVLFEQHVRVVAQPPQSWRNELNPAAQASKTNLRRLWRRLKSTVPPLALAQAKNWLQLMPRHFVNFPGLLPFESRTSGSALSEEQSADEMRFWHDHVPRQHLQFLLAVLLDSQAPLESKLGELFSVHLETLVEAKDATVGFPWQQSLQLQLLVFQGRCADVALALSVATTAEFLCHNPTAERRKSDEPQGFLLDSALCLFGWDPTRWKAAIAGFDAAMHFFECVRHAPNSLEIESIYFDLQAVRTRPERQLPCWLKEAEGSTRLALANAFFVCVRTGPVPANAQKSTQVSHGAKALQDAFGRVLEKVATFSDMGYETLMSLIPADGDAHFYLPFLRQASREHRTSRETRTSYLHFASRYDIDLRQSELWGLS
eukprot:INCI4171.2.p1 GENE.INCI4171.2~~INCI4171.2.p1  ORF type:complete len:1756 (-),score=289.03 INCI4171.2:2813-7867(-)